MTEREMDNLMALALPHMDKYNLKLARDCMVEYKRTGKQKYLDEFVAILENFAEEDKELRKALKR